MRVLTMLDSTTEGIWYQGKYLPSNQQIRQYFKSIFFQRHQRSSRNMRAKFWVSLVTGTSASGPLANVPVTRLTRYIINHVTGTYFRCTKSVPVSVVFSSITVYIWAPIGGSQLIGAFNELRYNVAATLTINATQLTHVRYAIQECVFSPAYG